MYPGPLKPNNNKKKKKKKKHKKIQGAHGPQRSPELTYKSGHLFIIPYQPVNFLDTGSQDFPAIVFAKWHN